MSNEKANVEMKTSCHQSYDKEPPENVLSVEGTTDRRFVQRLNIKKLQCIPVGDIKTTEGIIKAQYEEFLEEHQIDTDLIIRVNARKSVSDIVDEKSKQPWDIPFYGLIDKDFTKDESREYIMVTPTHDLETLLLKTDVTIFMNPEDITETYKDALYLAYLIGAVKQYLKADYPLKSLKVDKKEGTNDYENVIDVDKKDLKLPELIERLIIGRKDSKNRKKLSEDEYKELDNYVRKVKIIYPKVSRSSRYDVANGHDISGIMKLLCKNKIDKFIAEYKTKGHDCDVEFAIIEAYKLANFTGSPLHEELKKRGLFPSAITNTAD